MNGTAIRRLPDGRCMACADYGDPVGRPVLFCHGTPGSRLTPGSVMAGEAARLGIRLLVPDRPGYGLSDPQPGRTIGAWPRDVAALLDALGIERVGLLGYSLGGAYALACAAALKERIAGIVLCSSLAPGGAPIPVIALARADPAALRDMFSPLAGHPDALLELLLANASAPDKTLGEEGEAGEALRRDCAETLRQGTSGMIEDFLLAAGDWGFRAEDIGQPVRLWHGGDDLNVPCAASEWLAARLPRGSLRLLPGEGHLCLFPRWPELLAQFLD